MVRKVASDPMADGETKKGGGGTEDEEVTVVAGVAGAAGEWGKNIKAPLKKTKPTLIPPPTEFTPNSPYLPIPTNPNPYREPRPRLPPIPTLPQTL